MNARIAILIAILTTACDEPADATVYQPPPIGAPSGSPGGGTRTPIVIDDTLPPSTFELELQANPDPCANYRGPGISLTNGTRVEGPAVVPDYCISKAAADCSLQGIDPNAPDLVELRCRWHECGEVTSVRSTFPTEGTEIRIVFEDPC